MVTFARPVQGINPADFNVYQTGYVAPIAANVACFDPLNAAVSCADGPVMSATITPTTPLTVGEYYFINLDWAGSSGIVGVPDGAPVAPIEYYVRVQTELAFNQYPIDYKWATVPAAAALGGSYVAEQSQGGTETYNFVGKSIGIVTWNGPDGGKTSVSITNGAAHVTRSIDTYAAKAGDHTTTISGLAAGATRSR